MDFPKGFRYWMLLEEGKPAQIFELRVHQQSAATLALIDSAGLSCIVSNQSVWHHLASFAKIDTLNLTHAIYWVPHYRTHRDYISLYGRVMFDPYLKFRELAHTASRHNVH